MAWILDLTVPDIYTDNTVQGNVHNAIEPPYPEAFWYVTTDNDITHDGALLNIHNAFQPPYPLSFWFVNEYDVTHDGAITDIAAMGAFAYCEQLTFIVLPESLTSIGPEAFAESGLTEVTIPNNQCTYYSTSFPSGCVVTGGHLIE
ncbi:MAG: leucine-rich repeat protein [Bacteroidaceae bacterium]|nr:leucine-rich repeat protein [Bacteroidaceae bacterium]